MKKVSLKLWTRFKKGVKKRLRLSVSFDSENSTLSPPIPEKRNLMNQRNNDNSLFEKYHLTTIRKTIAPASYNTNKEQFIPKETVRQSSPKVSSYLRKKEIDEIEKHRKNLYGLLNSNFGKDWKIFYVLFHWPKISKFCLRANRCIPYFVKEIKDWEVKQKAYYNIGKEIMDYYFKHRNKDTWREIYKNRFRIWWTEGGKRSPLVSSELFDCSQKDPNAYKQFFDFEMVTDDSFIRFDEEEIETTPMLISQNKNY